MANLTFSSYHYWMKMKLCRTVSLLNFYLALLFLATNCAPENESGDPYIQELKGRLDNIPVEWYTHPGTAQVYEPNFLVTTGECKEIIVKDRSDLTLQLMDEQGKVLSVAGGEGRGPGEFQSIISLHFGYDDRLYVIDSLSLRITIYEIENGELSQIESVSYENPPEHFLSSVYITEFGNFGVFNQSKGFFTPENQYLLYRLSDDFSPVEQLLEIPGHERQKTENPEFTLFTPHQFLSNTLWGSDQHWFYYTTTKSAAVNRYNLETEEMQEISFFEMKERTNNRTFRQAVKNHYPIEEDPSYWALLDDIKTLPLLSRVLAEGDRYFLQVMAAPGSEGMTIYLDADSEKVSYFDSPQSFSPLSICDDTIYGINFQIDGEYELMSISL